MSFPCAGLYPQKTKVTQVRLTSVYYHLRDDSTGDSKARTESTRAKSDSESLHVTGSGAKSMAWRLEMHNQRIIGDLRCKH